ncbi:hypothetical protein J2Y45_005180 [Dyadobacter sp. BE34]|uniref:DUF4301 domain-containing protein n=1 Tax=Dyadobacter fermentans TaxID=94254 RepID=A0ABU1R4W2_9BACT|nr:MULTISPECIES: DUF4301 family protein [Dyadobacter]MDR6807980.1 hypothetical protein [Dyadobacter fermentans]MDR7045721.1 hypothetical protein [Dyadobacter sp. BE242]MDR7200034.1 hypothetical protein [Dyadobacter sp. BE34]MDR7217507.1 hypothetical protein [Dyadobacter sp. BE31]MDR7265925.1 hypothetical protein [Dyadobacter sp. BE32]
MFIENDIQQIKERGSDLRVVEEQVRYFEKGFPFLQLSKAATVGDGIIRLTDEEIAQVISEFDKSAADGEIALLKFVPASGAATRMFKSLFGFLQEDKKDKSVDEFFAKLKDFAFYEDLKTSLEADGYEIESADEKTIASYFLTAKGLGYGELPKGLLKFHNYTERSRTPLEEHLVEGAKYANAGSNVQIHFTVSPEHRDKFEKLVVEVLPSYQTQYGVRYIVSFSEQKSSTDTIAVNLDNTPFREKDDSLLFRPAGHGALLENLGQLDADIIFIKNIDNVVPDRIKGDTITYKKALAGIVLRYQKRIFGYLDKLAESTDAALLAELDGFFRNELCVIPPAGFESWSDEKKKEYFVGKLDRPLRACGMVKNQGEPGGGPFWAENADGSSSLQIVESAQVDVDNADQNSIFKNSTHFNPVDLVCAVKNKKGELYDLKKFRDPLTGFITGKSKDGKELKAQELPGLWNGSMADWNTLFVEVPLITFNPVKTVNDLLREQHQ